MESVKAKVHELDLHGKKLLRMKGVDEVRFTGIKISY